MAPSGWKNTIVTFPPQENRRKSRNLRKGRHLGLQLQCLNTGSLFVYNNRVRVRLYGTLTDLFVAVAGQIRVLSSLHGPELFGSTDNLPEEMRNN